MYIFLLVAAEVVDLVEGDDGKFCAQHVLERRRVLQSDLGEVDVFEFMGEILFEFLIHQLHLHDLTYIL